MTARLTILIAGGVLLWISIAVFAQRTPPPKYKLSIEKLDNGWNTIEHGPVVGYYKRGSLTSIEYFQGQVTFYAGPNPGIRVQVSDMAEAKKVALKVIEADG